MEQTLNELREHFRENAVAVINIEKDPEHGRVVLIDTAEPYYKIQDELRDRLLNEENPEIAI